MVRTLSSLTPLSICCALVFALTPTAQAKDLPKLEVKSKELDFGEIVHGEKALVKVALKNSGTAPLEIRSVKPSCGCTVADFPRVVAPGKTGELRLEFDSNERPEGYQSFRISIYTNDPEQKDRGAYCTVLKLQGEVRTLFRKTPHGAFFGEVIRGLKTEERKVRLFGVRGAAKKGFTLELANEIPDYLKVKVVPWASPDGRRRGQEIRVTLLPHVPLGSFQQALEFRTSVKEQPRVRVLCGALVNRRITAPASLHFGEVKRGVKNERVVTIERRDGLDGIPLAKIQHDASAVRVSSRVIGPRRLELSVSVPPTRKPGLLATRVTLLFDDPHQRALELPVFAVVRPTVRVEPPVLLLPKSAAPGASVGELSVNTKVVSVQAEAGSNLRAVLTKEGKVAVTATGPLPTKTTYLVLRTEVEGETEVRVALVPR